VSSFQSEKTSVQVNAKTKHRIENQVQCQAINIYAILWSYQTRHALYRQKKFIFTDLTCTDYTDRSTTDDDQSTTDNPQHPAISYDLIRIDDVRDEALHADADCINSGLLRQTPKGERENPEGMEHDVTNACFDKDDKPAQVDTEGNTENLMIDSIELDDHWNSNESIISETDCSLTQPAEVLVKTTWSIKNIFRRQKSLPLPDHKLGALKQ